VGEEYAGVFECDGFARITARSPGSRMKGTGECLGETGLGAAFAVVVPFMSFDFFALFSLLGGKVLVNLKSFLICLTTSESGSCFCFEALGGSEYLRFDSCGFGPIQSRCGTQEAMVLLLRFTFVVENSLLLTNPSVPSISLVLLRTEEVVEDLSHGKVGATSSSLRGRSGPCMFLE
jgi:hypothetical protein